MTWCRRASIDVAPSIPEVSAANRLVAPELLGRPRHHDPSGLHQANPVRQIEGDARVLLDEQNADALLFLDLPNHVVELLYDPGCETERRLVEEHQLRAQ